MAVSESQPHLTMIAETTFAAGDLYKFVQASTANARVSVVATTGPTTVVGTLLSQTYSTSTGANEAVTVGDLSGIGKVRMAGSTLAAGAPVAASSLGYGISPTTNSVQLGIAVDGSSGTTGRIFSVKFGPSHNL